MLVKKTGSYYTWYGGTVVHKEIYPAVYIPIYRSNKAHGG